MSNCGFRHGGANRTTMDAVSMSETSPSAVPPAPIVDPSAIKEIAPGVFIICDRGDRYLSTGVFPG